MKIKFCFNCGRHSAELELDCIENDGISPSMTDDEIEAFYKEDFSAFVWEQVDAWMEIERTDEVTDDG